MTRSLAALGPTLGPALAALPLSAALLFGPAPATPLFAQDDLVEQVLAQVQDSIIRLREHIHRHPELGNREFETAALVANHLRGLGFDEVRTGVAHTGVVGILRGGRPGPVVAVRADMDALPVTEDTPYPFKSTVRTTYLGQEVGVSHACGHDIHVAVQLGVATVLAAMRDQIPGTVKFIFQPAEEGPPPGEDGGARMMVAQGVLEAPAPSAIFGLHSFAEMEVGKVGFTSGPALAAVDHFRIRIVGQQSHGAAPHLGIDPVVMASQAVRGNRISASFSKLQPWRHPASTETRPPSRTWKRSTPPHRGQGPHHSAPTLRPSHPVASRAVSQSARV